MFVILIPAYKPGPEFPQFVSELIELGAQAVVVVDDGSGPAFQSRFEEVTRHPEVRVLRHAINLGKGAALKTGINAILCDYPDAAVVVTADADGQHDPADVLAAARCGEEHPGSLVLGARAFGREVPWRSRIGNEATRGVMRVVVGQKLADTQTGLRAIPRAFLPELLKIPSQGYEFELDMLLACRTQHVPIKEIPIRTIYTDGNASSHFRPLWDSMRIYMVLLRFSVVSLCTAAVDNLVFSALFLLTGSIAGSMVGGRLMATLFNFGAVKRAVFGSRGPLRWEIAKYAALVVVSGSLSFGLILLFKTYLALSVLASKVIAETLLFFFNFLVQRDVVFVQRGEFQREPVLETNNIARSRAAANARE